MDETEAKEALEGLRAVTAKAVEVALVPTTSKLLHIATVLDNLGKQSTASGAKALGMGGLVELSKASRLIEEAVDVINDQLDSIKETEDG